MILLFQINGKTCTFSKHVRELEERKKKFSLSNVNIWLNGLLEFIVVECIGFIWCDEHLFIHGCDELFRHSARHFFLRNGHLMQLHITLSLQMHCWGCTANMVMKLISMKTHIHTGRQRHSLYGWIIAGVSPTKYNCGELQIPTYNYTYSPCWISFGDCFESLIIINDFNQFYHILFH